MDLFLLIVPGCLEPFGSWCDAEGEDRLSWGRLNPKAGKRSQTCGLFFFPFLLRKTIFGRCVGKLKWPEPPVLREAAAFSLAACYGASEGAERICREQELS